MTDARRQLSVGEQQVGPSSGEGASTGLVMRLREYVARLNRTDGTLKEKVIRGGAWLLASQVAGKGVQFLKILLLVRLLSPEDFGLMRLAGLALGAITVFTQTGIEPAVVQHKTGGTVHYLNAAWTISALRGIALYVILFFLAPFISVFFKEPQLVSLIRVVSLSFIIQGLANSGRILFTKELDFKKRVILTQTSNFLSAGAAIGFGLLFRNVWCLIVGQLVGSFALTLTSYVLHPFRPRLAFDWKPLRELFGFGKHILVCGVLIYVLTQGVQAFVGKLLGTRLLGIFFLVYFLGCLPASLVTGVVSQLAFPVYAKVQDDVARLRRAYLRAFSLVALLSLPIAILLFVFSRDLLLAMYGKQYLEGLTAFRIFVGYGLLMALGGTLSPLTYGIGRPWIQRNASFWQLMALAMVIYPFTVWMGISGVALAATAGIITGLVVLMRGVFSSINLTFSELFRASKPAIVGAIVMIVAIFPFVLGSWGRYSLTRVAVGSIVACFLYVLTVFRSGALWGREAEPGTACLSIPKRR